MAQTERTRTSTTGESDGVAGNRRLTSVTAIALLVLLFVEGLTVLFGVRQEIRIHVFVGMLLLPPIALKLASVGYRFVRYYSRSPSYRAAGPPNWIMRALGPLVVLTTVTLFASGVVLIVFGRNGLTLGIHKLSFFAWFGAMSIHVLGHVKRLPGAVAEEWSRRARVRGTAVRVGALGLSLALGVILAVLTVHLAGPWAHHRFDGGLRGDH
jgi:hypothetical protein